MRIILFTLLVFGVFSGANVVSAEISKPDASEDTVVVVDKTQNKIHLTKYQDAKLIPFKTFHATLGIKPGDKLIEDDLKTPEGIYQFLFQHTPERGLKPKFGSMALYVSYPNALDKRGKKTGFDILVHGTDDPSRLKRKFDSKGCVVVNNKEVEEIWRQTLLKKTPIIITRDFEKIRNAPRKARLEAFVKKWLDAWQNKDMETYLDSYAYEFSYDNMSRIQYGKRKAQLAKNYETIKVSANDMRFFFHEKYDLVTFDQEYVSTLNGGTPGYKGGGKKVLYVQERNGQFKILVEELKK